MKARHITGILIAVAISIWMGCSKTKDETAHPTASIEPYYDLSLTDIERDSMQDGLKDYQASYKELHDFHLDNSVPMSLYFDPLPQGFQMNQHQLPIAWNLPDQVEIPHSDEELAFMPVYQLATLIKHRQVTSERLTRIYINRIHRYSDTLHCLITLLEESALEQARRADSEIAAGRYKGPLHGIPYGIKDLFSVKGTKTTWGAAPYKEQKIDATATVVSKLEAAGAVLVAKLTMGALAMGDIWYGGVTRNPWNLEQGSSGSSAGSASATSAGLVAFALGTETRGSIVSPSTRCGVTGLRPTFGAVSRYGAMTLSWSMDKIGPICRSAMDCALVFDAIRGEDGLDNTVKDFAFNYDPTRGIKSLKVGYLKSLFDGDSANRENNSKALETFKKLGLEMEPVELPADLPLDAMSIILTAEAGAAFDELTRSNQDDMLVNQKLWAWPNTFRKSRFIPAVEYINALRARTLLMEAYHHRLKDYDVVITPTFGGDQVGMTNLTGHPCLVMPDGFNEKGSPTSISMLGKLYGEAALIEVGVAFQRATEWEDQHPPMFLQ